MFCKSGNDSITESYSGIAIQVLFVLEQQGELAEQLLALAAEREQIKQGSPADQRGICIDAYRRVGSQLLELLQFVDVNAVGIRKILKKFDKRAAARALTDYYVSTRSNHPYSQLRHVSRHVVSTSVYTAPSFPSFCLTVCIALVPGFRLLASGFRV
jgi:SPX domain protein involved in polyphosphate accumulation